MKFYLFISDSFTSLMLGVLSIFIAIFFGKMSITIINIDRLRKLMKIDYNLRHIEYSFARLKDIFKIYNDYEFANFSQYYIFKKIPVEEIRNKYFNSKIEIESKRINKLLKEITENTVYLSKSNYSCDLGLSIINYESQDSLDLRVTQLKKEIIHYLNENSISGSQKIFRIEPNYILTKPILIKRGFLYSGLEYVYISADSMNKTLTKYINRQKKWIRNKFLKKINDFLMKKKSNSIDRIVYGEFVHKKSLVKKHTKKYKENKAKKRSK